MSRARTAVVLPLLATSLVAGLAGGAFPAASAASTTTTYTVPGSYPEGVTASGRTFYVTSTTDGAIFRGTVGTRATRVFEPGGTDGRTTAIGLEVTGRGDRLVVAGGGTGTAYVYDTRDGRLVNKYTNGRTSGTFVNDVAIARNGDAYVTDSMTPALYRIPAAQIASTAPAATRTIETFRSFTGTALQYQQGFNANGIALTQDGKSVVIVQSGTGKLFRVVLATKAVRQVDLGGATLVNGDGLELRGDVLYVTRNANGVISKVKLAADGSRGRLYSQISNPTFRFPTTSAFAGNQLLVVNSQFDERPAGNPETPFTVTGITNP